MIGGQLTSHNRCSGCVVNSQVPGVDMIVAVKDWTVMREAMSGSAQVKAMREEVPALDQFQVPSTLPRILPLPDLSIMTCVGIDIGGVRFRFASVGKVSDCETTVSGLLLRIRMTTARNEVGLYPDQKRYSGEHKSTPFRPSLELPRKWKIANDNVQPNGVRGQVMP